MNPHSQYTTNGRDEQETERRSMKPKLETGQLWKGLAIIIWAVFGCWAALVAMLTYIYTAHAVARVVTKALFP